MIPFKRLNFSGAKEEINKLLESGFIGLGNKVFEFEQKLAEYLDCKYVIATDSCTSALFICLKYENPTTVVIPSMTVPLVANAVLEAGCELKFNDNIGWVGSAYNLWNTNIYDSAHQLERNMMSKTITNDKIKYCFSFYPTKIIGSADGGAIATNDIDFAEWARSVITYGRNQTQKYKNSWEYDTERLGYKRHYTNLQAAICIEQLDRLDETNKKRKFIRDKFNDAFGLKNKSLYLYRINIYKDDAERRNRFIKNMAVDGIECGVHFKPLHLMNAFKFVYFIEASRPYEVVREYNETVSLPIYDNLTEAEQDLIIKKVKKHTR